MQGNCETNGDRAAIVALPARQYKSRYAHQLSPRLANALEKQLDHHSRHVSDLSDEMAILRLFVGDAMAYYSLVTEIPDTPEDLAKQKQKAELVYTARLRVEEAVKKVEDMALTISKIDRSNVVNATRRLMQDMLQQLMSALGSGLQQYSREFRDIGLPIDTVIDQVSRSVEEIISVDSGYNGVGAGTGPVISTVPSRITSDAIVTAMDETIPIYNDEQKVG